MIFPTGDVKQKGSEDGLVLGLEDCETENISFRGFLLLFAMCFSYD